MVARHVRKVPTCDIVRRKGRQLRDRKRSVAFVSIAPSDVLSVENILTPFIDFDDGRTRYDDESEKQDRFNDHDFSPRKMRDNHGLMDQPSTKSPF
jgi:hypothetical protein